MKDCIATYIIQSSISLLMRTLRNRRKHDTGVDGQTLDNMSLPRINRIIESIRNRTYQPKPAKRKYIPKKNGKLRPLGITSTDDKLVQEVVRMILEAIYEPTFSNNSHGFRPKRSCHTALTQVKKNFTGVTWIVEETLRRALITSTLMCWLNYCGKGFQTRLLSVLSGNS